ncbi:MAG: hypothetical protein M3R14_17325 [Acidobacteriota bacterium]|nr:hypothetical protein [Acidobacteriota bacterium]
MKVSFQADNDLDQRIVAAILRIEPTINFQTAVELNLHGLDDLSVLALAAFEGGILVSHDQSTMPVYFAEFVSNNTSAGVLIVPQTLSLERVVEELLMIWSASEADEWINRISYLPL